MSGDDEIRDGDGQGRFECPNCVDVVIEGKNDPTVQLSPEVRQRLFERRRRLHPDPEKPTDPETKGNG